jgi:hypothetical protein
MEENTPHTPSEVMPHHNTNSPTCYTFRISTSAQRGQKLPMWCGVSEGRRCVYNSPELTKQTDNSCWPRSLPLKQLIAKKWRSWSSSYYYTLEFIIQKDAHRAAVEERKDLPARGLPPTLDRWVRSRKVYSWAPAYSSIPPPQNQYDSEGWRPWWRPHGLTVEVATCDEIIPPGELPMGLSTLLSRVPRYLSATHWWPSDERSHRSPLPVPHGPQQKVQCAVKENCQPCELPWGSACCREAPIHFRLQFMAQFQVSPCARAGPRAAAVEGEGVGLSGVLVSDHQYDILLPDPRHAARSAICPPMSSLTCQVVMLRTQAVGMKSLQAVEWPADLATVFFKCWQSTVVLFL